MNARTDTERILDAFLAPEADRLADRVIDAALADIARTPQRRALRVPWRFPMPAFSRATSVAAVVLVAVVGAGSLYYLISNRPDEGIGQPTAGPSSTAPASPAATSLPTATEPPRLPEGRLDAGTYRVRPFTPATVIIDVTVPGTGWSGGPPNALGGPNGESNGPTGLFLAFLRADTINSDPCHWDKDGSGVAPQEGDIEVGPTVDDLANALAAGTTYDATTPVDVTLGGYSGKRVDLDLTPDPAGCDNFFGEDNQYFVFGGRDGGMFAQGGANRWQVSILDVEGARLIVALVSYEDTSAADISAAEAILESLVINP